MVIIVPSDWLEPAEAQAPEYGFTTEELLGVWARYPAWAPGGRYYRSSDHLPSSQPDGIIEVYCQEPPMKLVPMNVVIWSFAWAGALGMIALVTWLGYLVWGVL